MSEKSVLQVLQDHDEIKDALREDVEYCYTCSCGEVLSEEYEWGPSLRALRIKHQAAMVEKEVGIPEPRRLRYEALAMAAYDATMDKDRGLNYDPSVRDGGIMQRHDRTRVAKWLYARAEAELAGNGRGTEP